MLGICRVCNQTFDSGAMIAALAGGLGAQELVDQFLEVPIQAIGCEHQLTSDSTIEWPAVKPADNVVANILPASA